MNVLINTPLLKTADIRDNFDNKILVLFLGIIFALVIIGLLFIDFGNISSNQQIIEDNSNPSQVFDYA